MTIAMLDSARVMIGAHNVYYVKFDSSLSNRFTSQPPPDFLRHFKERQIVKSKQPIVGKTLMATDWCRTARCCY